MALAIAYVFFVLVGPMIFVGLIRPAATPQRFMMGAASAGLLVAAAWALRELPSAAPVAEIGRLAAMWLAWIVTIAMAVQALTPRPGRGRRRKWGAAVGAAATVLPWFGLSLAIATG